MVFLRLNEIFWLGNNAILVTSRLLWRCGRFSLWPGKIFVEKWSPCCILPTFVKHYESMIPPPLWFLRDSHFSLVTRKSVFALWEQQRRRSACADAQSDQRLYRSLHCIICNSTCYSRNFKTLVSLSSCADWFESYPVENPEDRFPRDEAHFSLSRMPVILPVY